MGEPAGQESSRSIGLIAGQGMLPRIIATDARARGYRVVVAALKGLSDGTEGEYSDHTRSFNAGKIGAVMSYFRDNGVSEAVFAGKIPKALLYDGTIRPDFRALGLLLKLVDQRDDTLIAKIVAEFAKEGISFLHMKDFCSDLLTPPGKLTKKGPSRAEKRDIEFGFKMAKEIGSLGIGQTVVVKDRDVMAVEAIEGTDEAIRRGGLLAGGGAVVVKVSRPGQDMRFDVPVVGPDTLGVMVQSKVRVLALEAGKSIFLERESFISGAEEAGITVIGVEG
ncbi:MAG: UDP-2,3-diacylglucosamine diphosphatase LpxI [Thermodesulfovibrionales bacterium]|nr:UDP-2,3-diacylglucosamine diphosphatase LpxI [Thermodesulfovibrionales bacterium]